MVFTTPIFLFLFLPLLLGLHALAPRPARNALLLTASLLFYAWGEGLYLGVMLFSIALNHRFGLWLGARGPGFDRAVLTFALVVNLGLLVLFKYAGFVIANLRALGLGEGLELEPIHMPIGISFFTFHSISYLVDIHRGKAKAQRGVVAFALYIALFPQLVAGPIVRYHELADQLGERSLTLAGFAGGVRRFILGMAKKMLIANTVAVTANAVFALDGDGLRPSDAWLGALCYTVQIYFDFSGYSDMAIGLAAMFGFRFPENFRWPYAARSITDFWRRWHMTLSNWFRDYLYIPLGGNRRGPLREHLNLLTVFFLCGLWHGASWTFIAWGLYHGALLVAERAFGGRLRAALDRAWAPLAHAYTLLAVVCGWVIFRATDLSRAGAVLAAMAGRAALQPMPRDLPDSGVALALVCAALTAWPLAPWLAARRSALLAAAPRPALETGLAALELSGLLGLLFASCMQVAAGTYNPFIYYRF